VCAPLDDGQAVLVRALEPLTGLDLMWARRPAARRDVDLANGPGKLCQALGLDRSHDGTDLGDPAGGIVVADDGAAPPDRPTVSGRIGISVAQDVPWRWSVPGNAFVSRARPG
jgi:DNA-3-methyladenine glycosylase